MTFDPEALSRCVGCGLCLPACPTFQVTHAEQHGPRGRIAGMRMLQSGEVVAGDAAWIESMETCVQCRACEPACPSQVQFGALMERARAVIREPTLASAASGRPARSRADAAAITDGAAVMRTSATPHGDAPATHTGAMPHGDAAVSRAGAMPQRAVDFVLDNFARRGTLRIASLVLAIAQGLRLDRLLPARLRVPRRIRVRDVLLTLRTNPSRRAAPDAARAFLFRGCVMDAWFRPVHRATARVLAAAGYDVHTTPAPPCCGALHLHAGRVHDARRLAQQVVNAYSGTTGDVVVNSAGCGAAMREYGHLLGTAEARQFSTRVRDFAEAVCRGDLPPLRPLGRTVMLQTACHLKNVQRVDAASEKLLSRIPSLRVLRPDDGDICCGAGGAYSLQQPAMADRMRHSKRQALMQPGVSAVVSANPGCILHLAAADVPMVHIAELVASALPDAAKSSDVHTTSGSA